MSRERELAKVLGRMVKINGGTPLMGVTVSGFGGVGEAPVTTSGNVWPFPGPALTEHFEGAPVAVTGNPGRGNSP